MRTFKVELDTAYADKTIKETGLLQGTELDLTTFITVQIP